MESLAASTTLQAYYLKDIRYSEFFKLELDNSKYKGKIKLRSDLLV